ncbi:MAG: hypothetical protein CMG60_08110 [Candidatus Marinimicrobia bacterium]|nr:hypothetical protein [Candidatus Neomarinimicrobiota bacterium]
MSTISTQNILTPVTANELLEYYKQNNITTFVKRSNGTPDMRNKQNRDTSDKLFEIRRNKVSKQIMENNKKQNNHNISTTLEPNYRKDITELSDEEIDELQKLESSCIICGEKMNNSCCRLPCDHSFCVNCIVHHSRVNNNCPLCRKEFCDKPKNIDIEKISIELVNEYLDYERTYHFAYENFNDSDHLYTYDSAFQNEIDDFAHIVAQSTCNEMSVEDYIQYKEEMVKIFQDNFVNATLRVARKIIRYYNEQI